MATFENTCDCAVVHLTPADDARFSRAPAEHFAAFLRVAINRASRPVSFALDCPHCGGNGTRRHAHTAHGPADVHA